MYVEIAGSFMMRWAVNIYWIQRGFVPLAIRHALTEVVEMVAGNSSCLTSENYSNSGRVALCVDHSHERSTYSSALMDAFQSLELLPTKDRTRAMFEALGNNITALAQRLISVAPKDAEADLFMSLRT